MALDLDRVLRPLWSIREFMAGTFKGYCMRFHSRGTIGFRNTVEKALKGSGYSSDEYIGATRLVQNQILEQASEGYRTDVGDNFITVWPNPIQAVRDSIDPSTGAVKSADPTKLKSRTADTKLGVTVAANFLRQLKAKMNWQKINDKGEEVDEQDDTVDPNDNPETITPIDSSTGTTVDTSTGGNSGGGDDIPAGNG